MTKPTKREQRERTERAAELLVAHAGERDYRLCTRLAAEFGIDRRTAQRYLSRARAAVAEASSRRIRDLALTLPDKYLDLIDRCRQGADPRAEVRALDGLSKLVSAATVATDTTTPTEVVFQVVRPRPPEPAPVPPGEKWPE